MHYEMCEPTYRACFGFLVLSVLCIWAGICYVNSIYEFTHIDTASYLISKTLLSVMLLVFAAYTLIDGTINEGIVMISVGVSTLTFSYCNLAGVPGMNELDIILATALLIASIMFLLRRNYMLFMASLIQSLSMSLPYFLTGYVDLGITLGIGVMVSGLLFGYFAIGGFLYTMMNRNILRITNDRFGGGRGRAQSTYEMVTTVGYYLFGLAWCIYMQVPLSDTYSCTMIVITSIILIIAVVSIFRGAIAEGIMLSVGSMLMIMEILCYAFLGSEVPGIFYLFFGIGTLFLVILFHVKGDVMIVIASAIISLMYIVWSVTADYDSIVLIVGCIPGIIFLYYSMSRWIVVERRIEYLPSFRKAPKRISECDGPEE